VFIWKSSRILELLLYQGAFSIDLRVFDPKRWNISLLGPEALPHSRMPFLLALVCFAVVSLLIKMLAQVFYSGLCSRATSPICTVGQVWLLRVNEICVDLFRFTLILHFFAHLLISLSLSWSFTEATAGSSCVVTIAVSSAKVAVVFSGVGRSLI
jgi:hypothetical protein